MLILVGVTIAYTLNGGLITKAKEASEQTQVEADKETLMMAALGTIDANGNINLSQMETPTGFSGSNGTYTKGEYTFTINPTTGAVTATKGEAEAGEPQLNQYGFYEGVVYEMHGMGDQYVYFGKNILEAKIKGEYNGTVLNNETIPGSQIQIRTNPSYEIEGEAEPFAISGTVIEIDGEPKCIVVSNGKLASVVKTTQTTYENQIEHTVIGYSILDEEEYLLVPNFELDPDVVFAQN